MNRYVRLATSHSALGVLDSGVVAALGLCIVLLAAKLGGTEGVGQVALAYTFVMLAVGLFRMLVGLPLLAVMNQGSVELRAGAVLYAGYAALAAFVVGLVAFLALNTPMVLLVAAWAGWAVIQDAFRYIAMFDGRYATLLKLDVALLTTSVVTGLLARDTTMLLACLTGSLILVSFLSLIALWPVWNGTLALPRRAWREHLSQRAWPLAMDGIAYTVAIQGALWIVAVRTSVDEIGQLRLAMIFAFPFSIVMAGLTNRLVQRLAEHPLNRLMGHALRNVALLAAVGALIAGAIALFAPTVIGVATQRGLDVPIGAVLWTLLNSVVLLACLPLFTLAVVERRIKDIAALRALSGFILVALVGVSPLGTTASGAAEAITISSLVLAGGIAIVEVRRWRSQGSVRAPSSHDV